MELVGLPDGLLLRFPGPPLPPDDSFIPLVGVLPRGPEPPPAIFRATACGFCPVSELKKLIVSLAFASSSVKILTCLLSSEICYVFGSSFLIGLFEMNEALEA